MFLTSALLGYVAVALAFEANHAERNQALLRALHGELLESGFDVVMESGFEGAVATEASRFEVSDVNGTRHECVVDAEAERGGDGGGGSGAHPGVAAPLTDPLAGLKGRCVQMNHGYWTYQWCHEHEVLQLHVDESGTTDASHSLGIYKPNAGGAGDSAELVQHFRGGEICPETSAPRRADVRLECCAVANAEDGGAALTVGSLTETSKCVYTIVLCVQALCVGAKPLIPDVLPASALLAPLQNACFQWRPPRVSFIFYIHAITMTKYSTNLMILLCEIYLQETWWTFEFCVGKHVRQFHAVQQKQPASSPTGANAGAGADASAVAVAAGAGAGADASAAVATVTVVLSEFFLGKSPSEGAELTQSDELALHVVEVDPAASWYEAQYVGGTACDKGARRGSGRSTEVHFMCARGDEVNSFFFLSFN